jgi:hypothetical protein
MPRAKGSIDMVGMKIPNPIDKYVGSRIRMRRGLVELREGIGCWVSGYWLVLTPGGLF